MSSKTHGTLLSACPALYLNPKGHWYRLVGNKEWLYDNGIVLQTNKIYLSWKYVFLSSIYRRGFYKSDSFLIIFLNCRLSTLKLNFANEILRPKFTINLKQHCIGNTHRNQLFKFSASHKSIFNYFFLFIIGNFYTSMFTVTHSKQEIVSCVEK